MLIGPPDQVLVAIITGIVIDSFAARREQDDEATDLVTNRCFICGKTRNVFEHLGLEFAKHSTKDHGIW